MGQLTTLISGKLDAFDTAPLIYYIEEHPDYLRVKSKSLAVSWNVMTLTQDSSEQHLQW